MTEVASEDEKMRIGILTLPLHNNYGGLLQAYALQQALKTMGHEAKVIKHHGLSQRTLKHRFFRFIPGILPVQLDNGQWCSLASRRKAHREVSKNTSAFVDENIRLTDRMYHLDNLPELNEAGLDAIVVGSDQVWRPAYAKNIEAFFLNFINQTGIRKIAYAASFGASDWELSNQETSECSRLLQSFHGVSVREHKAVGWCKNKFAREAELTVDPTILLDAAHYMKYVSRSISGGHLCTYLLDPGESVDRALDAYASKRKIPRISPMPKRNFNDAGPSALLDCIYPSMGEWLSAFYHSEIVVTDSFHGTVFAILFNKPFVTIGNPSRGMPRFETILGDLGLIDRLVGPIDDLDEVLLELPDIDWISVNERVNQWRQRSIDFLRVNLS